MRTRFSNIGNRFGGDLGPLGCLGLCVFLALCATEAGAALEKSSKKECAMCHVMWLDTFRSEQETLIPWQPGNVLMKETQGVVSSEEICYSCHDGYVLDSRHVAWKHNNHTTFEKPPENMTIPERFPLSNKDELYCGTCHTPHAMQKEEPARVDAIAGSLAFLRTPNKDSQMCEQCHRSQTEFRRTNGHPVHTDAQKIPEILFELGSVKGEKPDTVICQTCHRVHGAPGAGLIVMDNSGSALCMSCHEQRSIAGTQHDLRLTMPGETNIKGEAASEIGPCRACHLPHDAAGYKLWARKAAAGNPASRVCLSCHQQERKEAGEGDPAVSITGIGRYTHPNDIDPAAEGQKAAKQMPAAEELPLFARDGSPAERGRIQCVTCHNLHQWDPAAPEAKGGKDTEGTAANSFLRISADHDSALCVACHADKKLLLSNDHNLIRTAPKAKNIQGLAASASGSCGVCHIAHNAAGRRLWSRDLPETQNPAGVFCTGCHVEDGAAGKKPVGKSDHPVNTAAGGPNLPPPDEVAEFLPLYNAQGTKDGGDRIACRTCHDPHIWSALSTASAKSGPAAEATEAPANIEGNAADSFLRKPASPQPELCSVCHEDAGLLVGTDHDLSITAPESQNRMGQGVPASGKCGVCHAVHNSPEERLLWARELGPVEKDQHSMNAVCTSCHREDGIAEKKTPPVATHPPGQLINNVRWFDSRPTGYIKIFDNDWKEVNVGDLACSSCHSFSIWSYKDRRRGPGRNIEGNAGSSFLRAPSHKAVCIDCHGQTAPWRYAYFHSVEKRKMLEGRKP